MLGTGRKSWRSSKLRVGLFLRDVPQIKEVADDVFGCGDVPCCERTFAAVANGGREDALTGKRKVNRLELARVLARYEGDRERRFELDVRLVLVPVEQEERAEHVLVGLVVAGTDDELRIRVVVQDTLDDLTLVDGQRTDFEVLLADEH